MLNKLSMLVVLFGIIGLPTQSHASDTTQVTKVLKADSSEVSINQNGKTVSFVYSDNIPDETNGLEVKEITYTSGGGVRGGDDYTKGKKFTLKTKRDDTSMITLVKDASGKVQLKIISTLDELKLEFGPAFKYKPEYKKYITGPVFINTDEQGKSLGRSYGIKIERPACTVEQYEILAIGMGYPVHGFTPILLAGRIDPTWIEAKKDLLTGLCECMVMAARISGKDPQQIFLARCIMASITRTIPFSSLGTIILYNKSILPDIDKAMRNVNLRPHFNEVYGEEYKGLYNTAGYALTPAGCDKWKAADDEEPEYKTAPAWLNNWENDKGKDVMSV